MKTEKVMVKRKWKWYNKLFLMIKEKFKETPDYSVELENRLRFSRFIYSQWFILILLLLPVLILSFVFVYFYLHPSESAVFNVNLFDAVAVVVTYLGTTFLALVVWHSTWLQKREKENESAIRVVSEVVLNMDSGNFLFEEKDRTKIKISITNQNDTVPISIKFVKLFECEKNIVSPTKEFIISYADDRRLLSFGESEEYIISAKSEDFKLPKHLYAGLYISNAYGHKVYCIIDCNIDTTGWCTTECKNGTLMNVWTFDKLKEKFGYDFLREIVWYSPAGWKKKYINRIHLFKTKKKKEKDKVNKTK